MTSRSASKQIAPGNDSSSPVGYAHRRHMRAPKCFDQLLHTKGFAGGVPLNTETTAVKPRVGIA